MNLNSVDAYQSSAVARSIAGPVPPVALVTPNSARVLLRSPYGCAACTLWTVMTRRCTCSLWKSWSWAPLCGAFLLVSPAYAESISSPPDGISTAPAVRERGAEGRNERPFGPVQLGAFAGIGFPRPLSIEAMLKLEDLVGVGLEYSALPSFSTSGVNVTLNAIDADFRLFPLHNGFFVGAAVGHQQLYLTSTVLVPYGVGPVAEQVSADTWFVNPRIGFLWTWRSGLTLGTDAGLQIPVAASFTNTIPSEFAASATATDVSHVIGKDVLPSLDLLRIGMLF